MDGSLAGVLYVVDLTFEPAGSYGEVPELVLQLCESRVFGLVLFRFRSHARLVDWSMATGLGAMTTVAMSCCRLQGFLVKQC